MFKFIHLLHARIDSVRLARLTLLLLMKLLTKQMSLTVILTPYWLYSS